MSFDLQTMVSLTQAEVRWGEGSQRTGQITELLTDTRHLRQAEVCLFVALVTAKNDGHKYIGEAYRQGVRSFIVGHWPSDMEQWPMATFLKVKSPLDALQTLARSHRMQFNIPVIGITGSNGKTIVKEWLGTLLEKDKKVVKSPKSYNSQIGVPLSVWEMNAQHQIGVFEAGISEPEEMERLERILLPEIGIFTNIGTAHESHFLDISQKIAEKLKLFTHARMLIFCAEHFQIKERILSTPLFKQIKLSTWSLNSKVQADLQVIERSKSVTAQGQSCTFFKALYKGNTMEVEIPFVDQASIENAMHCWMLMLELGYEPSEIRERMKVLQSVEMRMEMKEGLNHNFIINDAYSSDFDSFVMAVDFLCYQASHQKKRIILSDILQSGLSERELYIEVARVLEDHKIDALVGIGPQLSRNADLFKQKETTFYSNTDEFLLAFDSEIWSDETILLKGARIFEFERIDARLQKKVHQTVLEIDMNAMIHNLNFFRSCLKPTTKIMIMGKAFSYGSGSYEIAHSLAFHRSDYMTVAYTDEGVALRKKGVDMPIMVVNAEAEGMENVLRYHLEPEIYSFRILEIFKQKWQQYTEGQPKDPVWVHLKLDTGMHRLGFEEAELPELVALLNTHTCIKVRSVFTHLATADDPSMDAYTLAQLDRFDRMSAYLRKELPYGQQILRHALNTAGICRFPEYQYDMVRLGIGLYGVGVTQEMEGKLETVSTWKTTISQIRTIPVGDAVGYGRRFVAQEPTRIGIIGVGYADGLNRRLGNGVGKVWIKGQRVPIIGNVCMDMCMLDLTQIEVQEGEEVIIFGKQHPLTQMAESLQTIPYEILTAISPRVKRIYYQE